MNFVVSPFFLTQTPRTYAETLHSVRVCVRGKKKTLRERSQFLLLLDSVGYLAELEPAHHLLVQLVIDGRQADGLSCQLIGT